MRKERNDSVVEVWDRDYINFPDERNEEDKEAHIIQIEHGHEDDYIVEIVRGVILKAHVPFLPSFCA